MLTRVFWTLFTVEAIAVTALMLYAFGRGGRGWGPEGPVGAWLIFLLPLMLLFPAAVVLIWKNDAAKIFGICCLAIPLLQIALGPLYSLFQKYSVERSLAGDDSFTRPAQRNLAHAIRNHDVEAVKRLIPAAGDLNHLHRGESLFRFALVNADQSEASLEIVKAMLAAGANPNEGDSSLGGPLALAFQAGPKLTEAMLKAGADPNRLDDAGRPVWWGVLHESSDSGVATLETLLAHGADLTKRDSEGGPVAWAAYHAMMSHGSNWRVVHLLVERGAAWKNEQEFGRSVRDMLADDFRTREHSSTPVTEEMRQLMAKFSAPQ